MPEAPFQVAASRRAQPAERPWRPRGASRPGRLRTLGTVALLTWLPVVLALVAVEAVRVSKGIPVAMLTDDRTSTLGVPFYVGLLSNLGVMLWCAAGSVCLFASGLVRDGDRQGAGFLACFGVLTMAVAFDDLFLIHESVAPDYLGIPESVVYLGYGAIALAGLLAFARVARATEWPLLGLALAMLGLSIVIDESPYRPAWRHLAEDGAKLLGLALWLVYFTRTALARVRAASVSPGTALGGERS